MKDIVYHYGDGQEIQLGDTVRYNGKKYYVERIYQPNTQMAIWSMIPRGGILLSPIDGDECDSTMGYDAYDLIAPEHRDYWVTLESRATLSYHWHFLKRNYPDMSYFFRLRIWKRRWWEIVVLFYMKRMFFALLELFQAVLFGPGKNVRQLI